MLLREIRDAVVNLAPHLVRRHRPELAARHLHRQIQFAAIRADIGIDDRGSGRLRQLRNSPPVRSDFASRKARCASGGFRVKPLQPLERQRQMRAALVVGNRVDFVHDHRFDRLQNLAAFVAVSRM